MLGYAHAAGVFNGVRTDIGEIARYLSIPEDRLIRAAVLVESENRPEILLLQNPNQNAKVGAAVLFSSAWSKAYAQFGTPYGRVHRDFHYQVMFSALAALAEVGCVRMRIDHPMLGHQWRNDAYVCLLEATRNVRANMGLGLSVWLRDGEYDPAMPKEIEKSMLEFDFGEHRPVGISPHVFEGLNMRTVFVEKAVAALRKAGVPAR